jgi:hypothetical protein
VKIEPLVTQALNSAKLGVVQGAATELKALHVGRSRQFVEALVAALRKSYIGDPSVVVLSKFHLQNRNRFGLNELLYDISVCDTATTLSAHQGKELTYVRKCLWSVESEFARDTRQAIFDFNKLVMSSADNKLFVGPQVTKNKAFLATLGPVADSCSGSVTVALIPHPAKWVQGAQEVHFFRRSAAEWISTASSIT